MIPKIIHWCWLSGEPVPAVLQKYMESWNRVMPDWKIKCWTQKNFDVKMVQWVAQAVSKRKWAYAADYIRLWVLYHEGGVWLDSDVLLLKSFELLRKYDFFTAIEIHRDFYTNGRKELDTNRLPVDISKPVTGLGLQAAIMGAKKGNAYLSDCMKWYESHNFINPDGSLNLITMPGVLALHAIKYGFRYEDKEQDLDGGLHIFDSTVFAGSGWDSNKKVNYAIHYAEGSWRDYSLKRKIIKIIKRMVPRFIRRLL